MFLCKSKVFRLLLGKIKIIWIKKNITISVEKQVWACLINSKRLLFMRHAESRDVWRHVNCPCPFQLSARGRGRSDQRKSKPVRPWLQSPDARGKKKSTDRERKRPPPPLPTGSRARQQRGAATQVVIWPTQNTALLFAGVSLLLNWRNRFGISFSIQSGFRCGFLNLIFLVCA